MSNNLRQIRQERGLTQADLARAIGTTQTCVSDIERGVRRGLPITRRALSSALTAPIEVLFPPR